MSHPDISGHYTAAGLAFSVAERDGRWVMVQPEVPEPFQPVLEWTGPATVRIVTGPLAGVEVVFDIERGRVAGAIAGGVIPVEPTDQPPEAAPGAGLSAPGFRPDPQRDSTFETAWRHRAADGPIAMPPGYPVHTFVQWLMRRDEFVFHGSSRMDIEEFRPRRESMEINDLGGVGNLEAVYATQDGLWAMFFAIVDRDRLRGSIRNDVGAYSSLEGERLVLYRFSIEERSLAVRPFCPGALYVLPRDRFRRLPLVPGGPPSNEWACPGAVRPLATVSVAPDDFPFLTQIGGHDDGDFGRLGDLGAQVFEHVVAAVRIRNGVRLSMGDALDPDVRDEWIELGRRFYPDVVRTILDDTTIDLSGPRAFVRGIERRLGERLDRSTDAWE